MRSIEVKDQGHANAKCAFLVEACWSTNLLPKSILLYLETQNAFLCHDIHELETSKRSVLAHPVLLFIIIIKKYRL